MDLNAEERQQQLQQVLQSNVDGKVDALAVARYAKYASLEGMQDIVMTAIVPQQGKERNEETLRSAVMTLHKVNAQMSGGPAKDFIDKCIVACSARAYEVSELLPQMSDQAYARQDRLKNIIKNINNQSVLGIGTQLGEYAADTSPEAFKDMFLAAEAIVAKKNLPQKNAFHAHVLGQIATTNPEAALPVIEKLMDSLPLLSSDGRQRQKVLDSVEALESFCSNSRSTAVNNLVIKKLDDLLERYSKPEDQAEICSKLVSFRRDRPEKISALEQATMDRMLQLAPQMQHHEERHNNVAFVIKNSPRNSCLEETALGQMKDEVKDAVSIAQVISVSQSLGWVNWATENRSAPDYETDQACAKKLKEFAEIMPAERVVAAMVSIVTPAPEPTSKVTLQHGSYMVETAWKTAMETIQACISKNSLTQTLKDGLEKLANSRFDRDKQAVGLLQQANAAPQAGRKGPATGPRSGR